MTREAFQKLVDYMKGIEREEGVLIQDFCIESEKLPDGDIQIHMDCIIERSCKHGRKTDKRAEGGAHP